jgi:hypothetical protein
MRIDYQIEGSFALITRLIDYAELCLHVVSVNARFPQQKFVSGQYKSLMFLTGHSSDLLVHEILGGTN